MSRRVLIACLRHPPAVLSSASGRRDRRGEAAGALYPYVRQLLGSRTQGLLFPRRARVPAPGPACAYVRAGVGGVLRVAVAPNTANLYQCSFTAKPLPKSEVPMHPDPRRAPPALIPPLLTRSPPLSNTFRARASSWRARRPPAPRRLRAILGATRALVRRPCTPRATATMAQTFFHVSCASCAAGALPPPPRHVLAYRPVRMSDKWLFRARLFPHLLQ
jgi:hypothetical protein